MVDADTGEWNDELCAIGGVDPAMQAALGWAGRPIGPITAEVAAFTGLPADTLVVAGGGDQPCACLGMGMFEPGRVALATGTAWVITGVTRPRGWIRFRRRWISASTPRRSAGPSPSSWAGSARPSTGGWGRPGSRPTRPGAGDEGALPLP